MPLIVGANSYEGVLLRKALHVSEKEVERAAGQQYDELSGMYPPQLLMTDGFLADHIWGDAHFVEPARMIARTTAHKGCPSTITTSTSSRRCPSARRLAAWA